METINTQIRYYQPNDPYYWEVDNLPLTDLLNNDIVLQERLKTIEDTISGFGNTSKGAFGLNSISDLKAWTEPVSGTPSNFGKVFVGAGKFVSRVQLPATRESGWRMMRDDDEVFNNQSFKNPRDLASVLDTTDGMRAEFVRATKGVARTAVCEFYPNVDGTDKSISIDAFDPEDFNNASPPIERLDLIYIKGCRPLDTNYNNHGITENHIGVVKGAYFRTDAAAAEAHKRGPRNLDILERFSGRTTGMAQAEIPVGLQLSGFGTIPMPDDLLNFAWHRDSNIFDESDPSHGDVVVPFSRIEAEQISTQAAFCLPIAYVRVPSSHTTGAPINPANVIDIRPFLRTAELSYSERAAIANSRRPSGSNPFVTNSEMRDITGGLTQDLTSLWAQVNSNTGRIESAEYSISSLGVSVTQLGVDVSGTGTTVTPTSLNHEGRIASLEINTGNGITIAVEKHKFSNPQHPVFVNKTANVLGSDTSPFTWDITQAIGAGDRENVVAVMFRVTSHGGGNDTDSQNYFQMKGGIQPWRTVSLWGVAQANGDLRRNYGSVNSFIGDVTTNTAGATATLSIQTKCTGSSDVSHSMYIEGYICREYVSAGI
jgi:hypothetical protein